MWGAFDAADLQAALLWAGNALPVGTSAAALAALARTPAIAALTSSTLTGPRAAVVGLWRHVADRWGPPVLQRLHQDIYSTGEQPRVRPDPTVRRAAPEDVDALFEPSVAMFTEELGVSPLAANSASAYRQRIAALVRQGRVLLSTDAEGVRFKAELAVVTADTCQVQGVWVRPDLREMGLGRRGMAATVIAGLKMAPTVSLIVDSDNAPAVRTYRAVGMARRSASATVLLPPILGPHSHPDTQ